MSTKLECTLVFLLATQVAESVLQRVVGDEGASKVVNV